MPHTAIGWLILGGVLLAGGWVLSILLAGVYIDGQTGRVLGAIGAAAVIGWWRKRRRT